MSLYPPRQDKKQAQISDTEISLIDILRFLKSTYKTIAILGLIGIALSISYLAINPKKYEAKLYISIAQIGDKDNNFNPQGVNIEEPARLILRLSIIKSLTPEVIAACGLQDQENDDLAPIKLKLVKGLASVVELKTFGSTPQVAQDCGLAVFDLIKTTQAQMIAPYIELAKADLLNNEERMAKAKDFVAKADKSGSAMTTSYLSIRDEIRYLLREINEINNFIASSQNRVTRMVAPIYVDDVAIEPKKSMVLAAGLFGGLFIGLLIALARSMIARIKSQAG